MPYTKNEIHLMLEHLNERELKKVYQYINELKGRNDSKERINNTKNNQGY